MRLFGFLDFTIIGIIGFMGACCSLTGVQESREIAAKDFYGVVLDGIGNIYIHFAENYKVVVTASSNVQDIVVIYANEKILHIDEKQNNGINSIKLSIDIYTPELKSIELKGVGNIKIVNGNTSKFEMILSGKGNIDAQNYEAENVVINLSGTGNINTWVTRSLTGKHSGTGNILYKGSPPVNNINVTGTGEVKGI